jgi:ATP-dependent RNA helicase DeaD
LPAVYEELNDLTKQELIKRFASIEFNRFLDYYRNAPDLNLDERRSSAGDGERYVTGNRFFINLGKMDGLDTGDMLALIDDVSGVDKKFIGKVELKGAYSFFEVEKEKSDEILKAFKGVEFKNRQVRVEITDARNRGTRESGTRDFKRGRTSGSSFNKSSKPDSRRRRY